MASLTKGQDSQTLRLNDVKTELSVVGSKEDREQGYQLLWVLFHCGGKSTHMFYLSKDINTAI